MKCNKNKSAGSWMIPVISLILLQCVANGNGRVIRTDLEIPHNPYALPAYNPYDIQDIRNYKNLFATQEYWTAVVESFYKERDFRLAWIKNGKVRPEVYDLIQSIALAELKGLSTNKYNIVQIYSSIKKINSSARYYLKFPSSFVNLDVVLTYTYLEYAQDLLSGSLNPNKFDILLETHPRSHDLVTLLNYALENGNIQQSLQELEPDHEQYGRLKNKLLDLLKMRQNDNYPSLSYVPFLSENDTNINVLKVKKYLQRTGDLANGSKEYYESPVFDEELIVGVKLFQFRHGLKPDGKLDQETLAHMNMLLDQKIDKIRINMERIRWLPADLGDRYIIVNIPDYSLGYYENDSLKMKMKVIVGDIENYTPVLKDTLKYIVFNPRWNIPATIASDKMLKNLKAETGYYNNSNYSFFKTSYTNGDTISTDSIEWGQITPENFPFYAVQDAGPDNALGRVKFIFPNNEAIYLHDTPNDSLFLKRERDLSHGCVRLEKPFELAEIILKDQGINAEDISKTVISNKTDTVYLEKPVMVHFVYHTAWVDDMGNIHYRDDVYGLDKRSIFFLDDYPQRELVY